MSDSNIQEHDWEAIWQHFDRMQKRVMATTTTRERFFDEPELDRLEFYQWMQVQCGSNACWM